jgi:hypothetical protein
MRFGLRAKSVANVNDVKAGLISSRRIIFTPNTDLKDELASTAVQITCYDKDGKEVKRVTSTDDGNVEDEDEPTPDPSRPGGESENTGNGGSTSGNQGGNDNPGGGDDDPEN